MKPLQRWMLVAAAPLLLAAVWMDQQPVYKPYDTPQLAPPREAVPVTGQELADPELVPANPTTADPESVARGAELFAINCSFCHGTGADGPGPVGRKLQPPAPVLPAQRLAQLSDGELFQRVSFGIGRMPAFRLRLAPTARWDLVNFLRSRI